MVNIKQIKDEIVRHLHMNSSSGVEHEYLVFHLLRYFPHSNVDQNLIYKALIELILGNIIKLVDNHYHNIITLEKWEESPYPHFERKPRYSKDGDYISFFIKDESCYTLGGSPSIYYNDKGEFVGICIHKVSEIMKNEI